MGQYTLKQIYCYKETPVGDYCVADAEYRTFGDWDIEYLFMVRGVFKKREEILPNGKHYVEYNPIKDKLQDVSVTYEQKIWHLPNGKCMCWSIDDATEAMNDYIDRETEREHQRELQQAEFEKRKEEHYIQLLIERERKKEVLVPVPMDTSNY